MVTKQLTNEVSEREYSGKVEKTRDPELKPMRVTGFGYKVGEECGVVRGQGVPCQEKLVIEDGDRDELPRCKYHCREKTRNVDSLSLLCPVYRMRGRRKCRKHGGRALVGTAASGYIDGRASRWAPHAPKRYAELVESVSAGDPLDLHDDIHMLSARIAELFGAMGDGTSGDVLLFTLEQMSRLKSLPDDARNLLSKAREALAAGQADREAWEEVRQIFRERTKMVESQRKRDLEGGKYVTAEEMLGLFRQLGLALKNRVEEHLDKDVGLKLLADVSADMAAIQGIDDQRDGPPA